MIRTRIITRVLTMITIRKDNGKNKDTDNKKNNHLDKDSENNNNTYND